MKQEEYLEANKMTDFDRLIEEVTKSRKLVRRERYPKGFDFSPEFLDLLRDEYIRLFSKVGNRNFHSNFLKALSFKNDEIQDTADLYPPEDVSDEVVPHVFDIEGEDIPEVPLEIPPEL